MHRPTDNPHYDELLESLTASDHARSAFFKACLRKLGLEIGEEDAEVPSLTPLHLSSLHHREVEDLLHALGDDISVEDDQEYIRAEVDAFRIDRDARWSMNALADSLSGGPDGSRGKLSADGQFIDYSEVVKDIVPHERAWPDDAVTPLFHHGFYFSCLQAYRQVEDEARDWGSILMYGQVVTSTNTIIDK